MNSKLLTQEKLNQLKNGLFYAGLTGELLMVILDKSSYIIQYQTWWLRLFFVLFVGKIVLTKYSRKEWGVMALFVFMGICSYVCTDREEIIRVVALCAACKGMDAKKVLSYVFKVTLLGCLIIMGLSLFGIYGDVTLTDKFRNDILETRYTFGMGHPNAFHCMVLMLTLLWIYLKFDKLNLYKLGILIGINVLAYCFSTSRMGLITTAISIMVAAFFVYCSKMRDQKWVYIFGCVAIAMTVVLAVVVAWYGVGFNYKEWRHLWLDKIDFTIFSARLRYAYFRADLTRWSLFSCPENTRYFDMGIVRLFYWYGIIPGLVYMYLNGALLWNSRKRRDYGIYVMVLMFAFYQLFEAHTISVFNGRNYVLILLGVYLSEILHLEGKEEVYWWQFLSFKKQVGINKNS